MEAFRKLTPSIQAALIAGSVCLVLAVGAGLMLMAALALHISGDSHEQAATTYHASAAAVADYNGRALTDFEKRELWELAKTESATRPRQSDFDPSK